MCVLFLLISTDELDALFDGINRPTSLTNRDDGGPLQILLGKALNRRWHRSREECGHTRASLLDHRLSVDIHLFTLVLANHRVRGQFVEDEGQVGFETEIDHPIGFVHDDVTALGEDDDVALNDIFETTRGSDDYFGA